jgi:O-antigen biosynthesis protein
VANSFNAAKSDVKLLDYAALGLPALCSPGPAYQELLAAGLALGAEPGQWAEQILWAARHRRRLRRLAQAAHGYLWEQRSSERLAQEWLGVLSPTAAWHRRGR